MSENFSLLMGEVVIKQDEDFTTTIWKDGNILVASHFEQPGQAETAREIGMTVEAMNRQHDVYHTLICQLIGLPWSPALRAAAVGGERTLAHDIEEAAVLAVQKLAALYTQKKRDEIWRQS